MTDTQGSNHAFDQVAASRSQFRHNGSQRCVQSAFNRAFFFEAENIHPCDIAESLLVSFNNLVSQSKHCRYSCICRGEKVAVNSQFARAIKITCSRVVRWLQRHVAYRAFFYSFWRVIETVDTVTGDAALQEAVIVVLRAQPFVMVDLVRQVGLVTCRFSLD